MEKRYAPPIFWFYIHILIYQFPNGSINKICNLSTFFFINHFINNFTNPMVTVLKWDCWVKGLLVSCNRVNETVSWWSVRDLLVSQWLVGWWNTCRLVNGWLLVVDGLVEYLSVGRLLMEWWRIWFWLVVCGRWLVGDRWFSKTSDEERVMHLKNRQHRNHN